MTIYALALAERTRPKIGSKWSAMATGATTALASMTYFWARDANQ